MKRYDNPVVELLAVFFNAIALLAGGTVTLVALIIMFSPLLIVFGVLLLFS